MPKILPVLTIELALSDTIEIGSVPTSAMIVVRIIAAILSEVCMPESK